jgi:hypothetical protein
MSLSPDDVVDILDDLQHDLGKYLYLPLAFLPAGAPDAAVREAARRGLLETRRAGAKIDDAASIWRTFHEEVGCALDEIGLFQALVLRVESAFEWTDRLREETVPIDRLRLEADFSAVGRAIRNLRDGFNAG